MGKTKYIPIVFIFIFGIILWPDDSLFYSGNYWISGADLNFPLDTRERVLRRIEVLDWSISFGTDRANNLATVPLWTLHWLLTLIPGVSGPLSVIIYSCLILSLGYICFFRLLTFLFKIDKNSDYKNSNYDSFVMILTSLCYAYTPYTYYLFSRLNTHSYIMFLTPFVLTLFLKFLYETKLDLFDKWLVCLSLLIWFPLFSIQPPLLVTLVLFVSLFCLILPFSLLKFFKIGFSLAFLVLLFSAWWLIPYLNYLANSNFLDPDILKKSFEFSNLVKFSSTCSNFWNVITGFADTDWCGGQGYPHWPILNQIQNSIAHVILFLFLSVLGVIFCFRTDTTFKPAIITCGVVFLILSMGTSPPFGKLFIFIFDTVPYLSMYRAPWMKFGFAFYLAEYLAFGLALLSLNINSVSNKPLCDDANQRKKN